jgi:hypothetical protein
MAKNTCSVRSQAVSTVKKSTARIPRAWLRRNPLQVGPARRGAGPNPFRRRSVRIAVAETLIPSLASSPLIRRHPHRGFSRPHPQDELLHLRCDLRSAAGRSMSAGPFPAHQLAVPPKQRLRPDHERRPPIAGKHFAQRGHEQPVSMAEARPAYLPPEDRELMTKDEDLHLVGSPVGRPHRQGNQSPQEPVDKSEEHGSSLLPESEARSYEVPGQ